MRNAEWGPSFANYAQLGCVLVVQAFGFCAVSTGAAENCVNRETAIAEAQVLMARPFGAAESGAIALEEQIDGARTRLLVRVGQSSRVLEGSCDEVRYAAPVVIASAITAERASIDAPTREENESTEPPGSGSAPPASGSAPPASESAPSRDESAPPASESAPPASESAPPASESAPLEARTASRSAGSSETRAREDEPSERSDSSIPIHLTTRASAVWLGGSERNSGADSNDVTGAIDLGLELDFASLRVGSSLSAMAPIIIHGLGGEVLVAGFGVRVSACLAELPPLLFCLGADGLLLTAEGSGFDVDRRAVSGVGAGRVEIGLEASWPDEPVRAMRVGLGVWLPVEAPAVRVNGFAPALYRPGASMMAWLELVFDFS